MSKILAIDLPINASDEALGIAEKYSNMIREFFGNKTFLLERLTSAMYELPDDVAAYLAQRFQLYEVNTSSYNYNSSFLRRAKTKMKELDQSFYFLTESYIQHLMYLNSATLDSGLTNPLVDTIKIIDTGLDVRIKNALYYKGVITIGDLRKYTLKEISRFRNIGCKSLGDLQEHMKEKYGIFLD